MARINAKGLLSGIVGPVAFRVVNGKPIVSSKPGKGRVKQTAATKKSASEFGVALAAARKIRLGLSDVFGQYADPGMHRRFGTKVYEVLRSCHDKPSGTRTITDGDISLLERFDFNAESPFAKHCFIQPAVSMAETGIVTITLPESVSPGDFPQKGKATGCDLCFEVIAFNTQNWHVAKREAFILQAGFSVKSVNGNEYATAPFENGLLIIVTATIIYKRNNAALGTLTLNNKSLHPAEISAVFLT